jgi:hypothetical protein
MATELADLVLAGIRRAMASLAGDHGEGHEPTSKPADFVIVSDGESRPRFMGQPGLAPIRAPVAHYRPCQKGARGRRALENSREAPHFLIINNSCSSISTTGAQS